MERLKSTSKFDAQIDNKNVIQNANVGQIGTSPTSRDVLFYFRTSLHLWNDIHYVNCIICSILLKIDILYVVPNRPTL